MRMMRIDVVLGAILGSEYRRACVISFRAKMDCATLPSQHGAFCPAP
jgi:hypothetical protein